MIGTCDQCAEGNQPLTPVGDGEFHICNDCVIWHEQALDAATKVMSNLLLIRTTPRDVAAAVIKTYCEFTPEAQS